MKFIIASLLLFSLHTNLLFSQNTPTVPQENIEETEEEEGVDTVVVVKDPYVVRKTYYAPQEKSFNKFVEVFASSQYYLNYYNGCPSCVRFMENIKKSTSPDLSFSVGANFIYNINKLYFTTGLAYTQVKEKFNYSDTVQSYNGINQYNYLDLNVAVGYKLGNGKISYIPNGIFVLSRMLNCSGKTISVDDYANLINLSDLNRYRSLSLSLGLSFKIWYNISEKLKLGLEPFYIGNIRSITKSPSIYVHQRNFEGLKFGFAYGF